MSIGTELHGLREENRTLYGVIKLVSSSVELGPVLQNFHVSAGWGTYGVKADPIVGKTLAELVASGRTPELIAPFELARFYEDRLVSELAAAAVSP
ncbi:MAG TPA: hypothetical protein VKG82_03930 [Solirubrobacteraceae bacterium]|nr:hypothetical protein [Solirubrobacteraceae bacterium]HME04141.1 hypothetical protein [Solirubrobacteraceae bacterium]